MSQNQAPRNAKATTDPAGSTSEALALARRHARRAASEALLAARALLDAASLASGGAGASQSGALGPLASRLEELATALGAGRPPAALVEAIAMALDHEIARWEERSREEPDARAVLRAFIGLREILWEFGLRPARKAEEGDPEARAPKPDTDRSPSASRARDHAPRTAPAQQRSTGRPRQRVQRIQVRGS